MCERIEPEIFPWRDALTTAFELPRCAIGVAEDPSVGLLRQRTRPNAHLGVAGHALEAAELALVVVGFIAAWGFHFLPKVAGESSAVAWIYIAMIRIQLGRLA